MKVITKPKAGSFQKLKKNTVNNTLVKVSKAAKQLRLEKQIANHLVEIANIETA